MEPRRAFWAGKHVCVTGGTGFLGFHLVRQLLALDARVRVLALPPKPDHPLRRMANVEAHYGDLLEPDAIARALAGAEVVFHAAGPVCTWGRALEGIRAIHVEGVRNVLSAAAASARVVHVSSVVAVGASRRGEEWTEDQPFNLGGLRVDYVQAKHAAEQVALEAAAAGRPVVVASPGYLVGPEDYVRSVMGRLCVRFWRGRVLMAPSGGFNLVDVRDAARGCLLAAEHGAAGRRYILGGENHTQAGFLALLAQVAGLRPPVLPRLPPWAVAGLALLSEVLAAATGKEPYPSVHHARMSAYTWFYRSDRARAELGYHSRPLSESLADAYRWFAARGKVKVRGLSAWWMRPARGRGRAAGWPERAAARGIGGGGL